MSESTLNELEGLSRQAVELSRDAPCPEAELAAALDRIASRPPPGRRPAWRESLHKASAAAAVLLAVAGLVSRAPAAWAEVAGATGLPMQTGAAVAPAPPIEVPRARKLHGVVVIHVVSILAGYAAYALAWILSCVALLSLLFSDAPRLLRVSVRISALLLVLGVLLMAVGIFLGAVWAEANLGRYWGWDVKEINGLATLVVGVVWLALTLRQLRSDARGSLGRVEPGELAAACFWASIAGCWGIAYVGGGVLLWQTGLCIILCVLLNVALLAAARRAPRGKTPIAPG